MKKSALIILTLILASSLFAEITLETKVRISSYWAMHSDGDFSYKLDDNNDGKTGINFKGTVNGHTSLNMNIFADGAYDVDGGKTDLYMGDIYVTSELLKNVLAKNNKAINDMLSLKLTAGVKSFTASGSDYDFAEEIKFGGDGISQATLGTEKGLGLGTKLDVKTPVGHINGEFAFLFDLGSAGFQKVFGGRVTTGAVADRIIGTQSPQFYASLGYDLLGTRAKHGFTDFQLFGDVFYSNKSGVEITPKDPVLLANTGAGSLRTGGHAFGGALRTNIPIALVENDPYTRLTVAGSFAYFLGDKFSESDLCISTASTTALTFNPYYTFGADLGWFMPFSENMVMDVAFGIRGKSSMTYTTQAVSDATVIQQNQNIDLGGGLMFKFPNVLKGAQIGALISADNLINGEVLPNMDGATPRGFQHKNINLTLAVGGGLQQQVGIATLTYKFQAGVSNLMGNTLYDSSSDDPDFKKPEFIGAVGTEFAFNDLKIDLGFVMTPFGGLETELLDIKTGRDDLDAGTKAGIYLNMTYKF